MRDFPGGPVVKTSPSNAGGAGSLPSQRAKIPHALQPKNQNTKQKQYCNKFNKDFKNGPHQKNLNKKRKKEVRNEQWGKREEPERCRLGPALGSSLEGWPKALGSWTVHRVFTPWLCPVQSDPPPALLPQPSVKSATSSPVLCGVP